MIGVSIGCLFMDKKMSCLSETEQFMSSTYYVRVRNQASTCLTNLNLQATPLTHRGAQSACDGWPLVSVCVQYTIAN